MGAGVTGAWVMGAGPLPAPFLLPPACVPPFRALLDHHESSLSFVSFFLVKQSHLIVGNLKYVYIMTENFHVLFTQPPQPATPGQP